MKLTEFNAKPHMMAKKALKESFDTDLSFDKMNLSQSRTMLTKVKTLISEVKDTNKIYSSEKDPNYLKLLFMEQALASYIKELQAQPQYNARMVVEDEAIEEAQVILAAKDMIDSVQKMIVDVSDMLVKELPAVVESVKSEKGSEIGEQFEGAATEALTGLQGALTAAKQGLDGALSIVKGDGAGFAAGMPGGMGGPAVGMGDETIGEPEVADMAAGAEELPTPPEDMEEPESIPTPKLGRGKR